MTKSTIIAVVGLVLLVGAFPGYVGYRWVRVELARRHADGALRDLIPPHTRVVKEELYSCDFDGGGTPWPYCGTADVVLPGGGARWRGVILRQAKAHGYALLADESTAGAASLSFVRGHDQVTVAVPSPPRNDTCMDAAGGPDCGCVQGVLGGECTSRFTLRGDYHLYPPVTSLR